MPTTNWRASPWYESGLLFTPAGVGDSRWRGVFRSIARLATLAEPTYVWRGQESIRWTLVPSIVRKLNRDAPLALRSIRSVSARVASETNALLQSTRSHRHHVLDGWEMPELPLLALLQHSGAATPLLDVTTDPMVALHFASQDAPRPRQGDDGILIAIDARDDRVERFHVGETRAWNDVELALASTGKPLGIFTPPFVTPRIMAQRGRFVFGPFAAGIDHSVLSLARPSDWTRAKLQRLLGESRAPGRLRIPPVLGIRIPHDDKQRIREVIGDTFGLDRETLFPDFPGFAVANSSSGPLLTQR